MAMDKANEPGHAQDPYDINFCFPVRELENARVKVTPFIPSVHAEAFWAGIHDHPEIWTYLPFGPFATLSALLAFTDQRISRDPAHIVFAILDKTASSAETAETRPPPLAGVCGLLDADPHNLRAEVGMLVCLPAFQRRGIMHSAVAALLEYCLQLPPDGGLGLRRVQWQAHADNAGSIGLAHKLGFRSEGVQRWQRVLAGDDKLGNGSPERRGDAMPGSKGRDSAILAVCWDDWEDGVRNRIRADIR